MSKLVKLLRLADKKKYWKNPPQLFVETVGLQGDNSRVRVAAWRLFKRRRAKITRDEALEYYDQLKPEEPDIDLEVGCVNMHFLDSGSFTLWTRAAQYGRDNKCSQWDFYDTPEFWEYIDGYAEFVKANKIAIDLFANVDAIPNPKLTWRNQQYLEQKHGITPVPVIHFKTDLKWLRHYLEREYDPIALGGLVGSMDSPECQEWLDRCFSMICDTPDNLPKVRTHGFGVTNYDLMLRYPWWSVDSTSWTKAGGFGGIFVPHKRNGRFTFSERPYIIKLSEESPDRKKQGRHFMTLSKLEQKVLLEWLEVIKMPLGKTDADGRVLEFGVLTRHVERRQANLLFFEEMIKWMNENGKAYPWPFRIKRRRTLRDVL